MKKKVINDPLALKVVPFLNLFFPFLKLFFSNLMTKKCTWNYNT